jgi:hypothetical protein
VPAESERLLRRIGARDRLFLAVLALATLVGAVVAIVLVSGRSSGPSVRAGCVSVVRSGFMGGATYTYCGKDASAFCRRRSAAGDDAVARQCELLGLIARRPQATSPNG